jgi:hypothetical protein
MNLKGIVSRDFGVLFLIYLDRYEVPKRAGSDLFFILKRSSYLNFFNKVCIVSISDLNLLILELLPFEGFSASFDLTGLNPSK